MSNLQPSQRKIPQSDTVFPVFETDWSALCIYSDSASYWSHLLSSGAPRRRRKEEFNESKRAVLFLFVRLKTALCVSQLSHHLGTRDDL